jgi:hypothetical protein
MLEREGEREMERGGVGSQRRGVVERVLNLNLNVL